MGDLTALQQRKTELIRKTLNGSAWIADITATAPETLTSGTSGDPTPLPANYTDVGYITKDDGVVFSRDVETSDTTSWGASEPTRSDVVRDVDTVKWIMQESKRTSFELYYNVSLAGLTPDAQTGEVSFTKGSGVSARYWRWFGIAQDGAGADAIYIGRFHPRMKITAFGDQSWVDGTELQYDVTGTAYVDSALGYATKFFWGGPGWKQLLAELGFGTGS